jgi:uridine monophosphate synthetase
MISFEERILHCSHPISKKLFNLAIQKKSNLALSADVTTSEELIELIESTAGNIVVLKTHIDIISDFTPELTIKLRQLALKYDFLIFEDRKFADIGNTVLNQFKNGIYAISEWADIINAHSIPGEGIIKGLKAGCGNRDIGLLLLAQMSSQGNLFSQEYIDATLQFANNNQDFVIGFIAQEKLTDTYDMITMTPGVQLNQSTDDFAQSYNTPEHVIGNKNTDIIIVGRGIYKAGNPRLASEIYKKSGWDAYLKNIYK